MLRLNILYKNTVYLRSAAAQFGTVSAERGRSMIDEDWTQRDDYYWQGPAGWTISRVFVDGMWQYELWFSRGGGGTIYGMRASLEGAQELYQQKLR